MSWYSSSAIFVRSLVWLTLVSYCFLYHHCVLHVEGNDIGIAFSAELEGDALSAEDED